MRKTRAKRRIVEPDPKFQDVMVTRFINNMMFEGRKSTAATIKGKETNVQEKLDKEGNKSTGKWDALKDDFMMNPKKVSKHFEPAVLIDKSLEKVGATRHWNTIFNAYNRFAREKVNPDLVGYVTDRALYGIFMQLGEEERKIRKDPLARTTDLLRRVFGKN